MVTPVVTKPVASDDHYTFTEAQTIAGNMLSNDTAGSNGQLFLRSFDGSDVLAKQPNQVTDIAGTYGVFHVKADGSFTYTLNDSAKVNFFAGQTYHESVNYKISDGAGHTDNGVFTLDIQGVTVKPVAVDDKFTFTEGDKMGGNILSNDIVGETGQLYLRSVTGTDIAAKQGVGQVTDVAGKYGTFHFHADGSYTYDLDAKVAAGLDTGHSVTENMTYKISDGKGHTDQGNISLTVNGVTDHVATTTVLDFEDVATTSDGVALGDDYKGFHLSVPGMNVGTIIANGDDWVYNAPTGYDAVSQENGGNGHVAYNPYADVPIDVQKVDHSDFDFVSGVFAAAWDSTQDITITGLRDGATVYTATLHLSNTSATTFSANWHDVDDIQITTTGQHIAMDDLTFAAASPMPV